MEPVFGSYFGKLRRERVGMSLRRFAELHGYDAGNLSKLERGKLPPPQSRDKLEAYATALALKPGSDEWLEFFDRAAAARGHIPDDLLDDAEVVGKLPLLFRTLRGDRVAEDNLDRVVDTVRRA